MAVTLQGSGTKTATGGGVEDTLLDVAVAGTYTLHVSSLNMVAGDILELRVKAKMLTGDSLEGVYYGRWDGAQPTDDLHKVSVPISNDLVESAALRFTLEQSGAGTDKDFKWKVLRYA